MSAVVGKNKSFEGVDYIDFFDSLDAICDSVHNLYLLSTEAYDRVGSMLFIPQSICLSDGLLRSQLDSSFRFCYMVNDMIFGVRNALNELKAKLD